MRPRRTKPAAIVVDRCQCSKVARSVGDKMIRMEGLRPRAMVISFLRRPGDIGRHTGMLAQSQANLDIFS
jgi:hypothetical protein